MDDLISRKALIEELNTGRCCYYGEEAMLDDVIEVVKDQPTVAAEPVPITGDTSDGYHTFNELYHHRAALFSVICNDHPELAWKSRLHHDGTMYDGMFIVGIKTPGGQATYHYDIDPYWDMFRVHELPQAPEWDGHTPGDAIDRIGRLPRAAEPVRHARWIEGVLFTGAPKINCSDCGAQAPPVPGIRNPVKFNYCHVCGARMDLDPAAEKEDSR